MLSPSINEQLLELIKSRKSTTKFNRGILVADRYVKTLEDYAGTDLCYRYGSKGSISFNDAMTKA